MGDDNASAVGGNNSERVRVREGEELAIDNVLSTQPELGPIVPDGGYGWLVFLATLFFQAVIPSLAVSYGMFLAFSKLPNLTKDDINPRFWDHNLMYTPLFFIGAWTFFDPISRALIAKSTWPRLVGASGTCLTCAGLLFLWMGMVGYVGSFLYILSGLLSGLGSSVQMAQCEILIGQYFKLKHTALVYVSQAVCALGFVVAPIAVGHHILSSNLWHVILWYQAIILQGLIANLAFKKPYYLKSKYNRSKYNYVSSSPDDEEDIFSKNSRELQIKNPGESTVTVEIPSAANDERRGKNWETFEDEEIKTENEDKTLNKNWVTFEDDDDGESDVEDNWERVENVDKEAKMNNLKLEMSLAEERQNTPTTSITGIPIPLFADLPVNNNNTYSYEVIEQTGIHEPVVFMPNSIDRTAILLYSWDLFRKPTFYKSLLTVVTTKYSFFIYFTLFPTYLFQELSDINIHSVAALMGILSLSMVFFSVVAYWVNIDKRRRPICLWFLCWMGSFGYFMISDSNSRDVLTFGAIQITVSISTLQYVGMPLLGLTLRGECNREFGLISTLTGISFLFFLFTNSSYKNCFRFMALLHFFTGTVWFSNYIYKKIMK